MPSSALYSIDSTFVNRILWLCVKSDGNGFYYSIAYDMKKHEKSDYWLKVFRKVNFETHTRSVLQGKYFRKTLEAVWTTRNTRFNSGLVEVPGALILKLVQVFKATNIQRVRNALTEKSKWVYSVTLDGAQNKHEIFVNLSFLFKYAAT